MFVQLKRNENIPERFVIMYFTLFFLRKQSLGYCTVCPSVTLSKKNDIGVEDRANKYLQTL